MEQSWFQWFVIQHVYTDYNDIIFVMKITLIEDKRQTIIDTLATFSNIMLLCLLI